MRLRLDQLEALVWIARLGSFRAAAKRLNISQPAVSGRIRELERQAGTQLIDRSQMRPGITRRGAEIVRRADQIMRLSESLVAHVSEKQPLVGTVRMGIADSFAVTYLPALLARFAERLPAAQVELDVDYSANLDRKLRQSELDLAFLHAPSPCATVTIEPLLDVELAWFASPRLRLPTRTLKPGDLVSVPILTNPRPSHLYGSILDWFGADGLAPQRISTCNSLSIIAKLTGEGFGISILPTVLVSGERRNRALRRLQTKPTLHPSHLTVACRTDAAIGDLGSVVELVREVVRQS